MLDDLRSYLQMATGITEATTAKAREVVSGLLASGVALTSKAMPASDMVGQVQELADDLVATNLRNRELLTGTIRAEVDKVVGRMGLVREDELAAVRRHVQRLQSQVHELREELTRLTSAQADLSSGENAETVPEPPAPEPTAEPGAEADRPKKKKKIIVDPEAGA